MIVSGALAGRVEAAQRGEQRVRLGRAQPDALGQQRRQLTLGHAPAAVDDHDPVAGGRHVLQHVAGEQDRPAVACVPLEALPQRSERVWVQPARRLVEQEHLRLGDQRRGEREPPPRPVRARTHDLVRGLLQVGRGERRVDVGGVAAGPRGGEAQLVPHRARGMEPVAVEHATDAAVRLGVAARRAGQPEQDPKRRRLPGPVGPEEAAHAPLRHRERQPVDGRRAPPETLGQVLDDERIHLAEANQFGL